jgi:hypothetical protein
LTITEHDTEADRLRMARRACLVVGGLREALPRAFG